jgi:hypothetical protein
MKKITLLLFALFSCWQISAQVSSYAFSQTSGTYTPITGGTVLGVATNDDTSFAAIPIGFSFVYNGVSYTQIGVQTNGWITFGGGTLTSSYNPLSTGTTNNVVSAFAGDLQGNTAGELSHQLSGTAPNQVLTIQWKDYRHFASTGDVYNFQIKLYETTNVIDVVYGSFTQNATNRTREVGLRGAANTAFNNRTTTTNWSATTSGAVNTANCTLTTAITPSSGLTFTWTPPTCPGSTGLVTTNITTTTATITWTEPTSIPANGYEYIVSSSAVTPTGAGTASATNSAAIISLTQNTSYFVFVRSICGTDIGTWVLVGTFKTLCDEVTDFVQTFDTFTTVGVGILPDCWSRLGTSTSGNIVASSVAPMSAPNRLLISVGTTTTVFLVMPPVSNLQAATHRLRFKAYATAIDKVLNVGYFTNPADLSTFVQLQSFAMPSTAATTAQEFTFIPAALPAGVNQLVFTTPTGVFTTIYVDDVKWEFNSPCVEPSQLTANFITNTSAQLAWVAGAATTWEIQYGAPNFFLGTGTIVSPVSTNPYVLSGLTPNTSYQYYVRGICAGPINSSWAGPFSFRTQCDDVTTFAENFDAPTQSTVFNGPLPNCWTKGLVGAPTLYVATGSVAPMSPSNRLVMTATAAGTLPTEAYAILPPVSNLQANTHRLRFKAYATVANRTVSVGYMTDVSNTASFVELQQITLPGTAATTALEFIVIPGALPAGVKHLAIRNNGFFGTPLGSTTAYFDDFSWEAIPTCIEPSGLTASLITNTTAVLGWTEASSATAWEIQYGAPGFAIGTGTIVPAPSNPFTLTALTPNTNYVYYVRAVCSVTESSFWTGPFAFKTQCDDLTSYSENFDALVSNFSTTMPDCWSRGLIGTPSLYVTTGSVLPMSPANRLYMFVSSTTTPPSEAYAILPAVSNLNDGTHRLRFKAFATQVDRFLELGYLTDPSNLSTFVYLTDFQVPGTAIASTQQFIYVPLTTIPDGVKHLAIKNPGFPGNSSTIYIDDVAWEAIPTCVEPTGVSLGSVLATTATLNWTAASPAPANGYEYYVATTSTNPIGTTVPTGSVGAGITTAALTALTPSTQYYVWVRSVCSASDKSAWTTIVTFTTPCASFTPAYIQPFTTWAPSPVSSPACWERYGAGTQVTGPTGAVNSGSWFQDGYLNVGATGAAKINIWTTGVVGWLVSPVFDLTTGGYQVKYKVGATQFGGTGPITGTPPTFGTDDFVYVLMSTDGGATWTNLTTYNAANTPSNLGATATFNIPTVTSNAVKFAFYGTSGSANEGQDIDFFIDDFEIQTIPLAAPVCSATVTAVPNASCGNEATVISWSASAGADGYKLTIGTTAGGSNILNNLVVGGLTYSYIGNLNTTYYYKVVPFNANGDATGCAEQSFTTAATGCYCPSVPTSLDGTGITSINVGTTNFTNSNITYTNNTATPVSLQRNVSSPVTINFATGFTYNTYIWIDLNDNFIFDASELLYTGESAQPNPSTLNASVAIPATAPLGAHRMRIVTADFLPAPDSCYSGSWGVTVDFTVNVIEEDLSVGGFDNASFKYYPNPVTDILTVSYSSSISDVVIYNLLGQQVVSVKPNATQTQVDLSGLTAGTYMVKVTSDEVTKTVKVVKN